MDDVSWPNCDAETHKNKKGLEENGGEWRRMEENGGEEEKETQRNPREKGRHVTWHPSLSLHMIKGNPISFAYL